MLQRLCFALVLLAVSTVAGGNGKLRLATSTSTVDSGLLDVLLPVFQQATGYRTQVFPVGTGNALRMGREGKADVLLVHAREAEEQFIREGHGLERHPVMHNDFVIVGPGRDPAGIAGLTDAAEAMRLLRDSQSPFLSRGDDSGTHKKELLLWQSAGIDPYGAPWYYELGLDMGGILRAADERRAYTMIDRGTWLNLKDDLQLQLLVEKDPLLQNTYGVIAVNSARHPQVNAEAAQAFVAWICSPAAQRLLRDYRKHGETLYFPGQPTE